MALISNQRKALDRPKWEPLAALLNTPSAGSQLAGDMRNNATRHPLLYYYVPNNAFYAYNPIQDDWLFLSNPSVGATFGAGTAMVFHPSQGPRGTIAAGATTTSLTLTTALPAAVGVNQLANRGDGVGFILRIVGSGSGGSGRVAEVVLTANSGGTTPTLYWNGATPFTPVVGDTYELLSGRVFLLGEGTFAAGSWKYYDVATNSFSGNLSIVNLPVSSTIDTTMIALSELHVPYNQSPSGGYYGQLVATASAAGSITGTAAGADKAVFSNQWRNFQVRVVQDTTNTTAVGQRRRISGNTAGPSAVYSLYSNWTVTPSGNAVFVIENDDDKIILWLNNNNATFTYNISSDAWNVTIFAVPTVGLGAAGNIVAHAFGIVPDVGLGSLNSQIYRLRGGNTSTVDIFDIAGAATGSWSLSVVYGNVGLTSFNTGTSGCYDPWMNQGRYVYLNVNATQHNARFDLQNRVLEPSTYGEQPVGAAQVGCRHAMIPVIDPTSVPLIQGSQVIQISPAQALMNALPIFNVT